MGHGRPSIGHCLVSRRRVAVAEGVGFLKLNGDRGQVMAEAVVDVDPSDLASVELPDIEVTTLVGDPEGPRTLAYTLIACPTTDPLPMTRFSTPSGNPARCRMSTIAQVQPGTRSAGLMTTVLP